MSPGSSCLCRTDNLLFPPMGTQTPTHLPTAAFFLFLWFYLQACCSQENCLFLQASQAQENSPHTLLIYRGLCG